MRKLISENGVLSTTICYYLFGVSFGASLNRLNLLLLFIREVAAEMFSQFASETVYIFIIHRWIWY